MVKGIQDSKELVCENANKLENVDEEDGFNNIQKNYVYDFFVNRNEKNLDVDVEKGIKIDNNTKNL